MSAIYIHIYYPYKSHKLKSFEYEQEKKRNFVRKRKFSVKCKISNRPTNRTTGKEHLVCILCSQEKLIVVEYEN